MDFNILDYYMKYLFGINVNNNFYYLFGSLILILILSTVLNTSVVSGSHHVISSALLLAFVVEIRSLKHKDSWKSTVYILIILVVALMLSKQYIRTDFYEYFHHSIFLIFFTVSFVSLIRQVFSTKRITGNILIATLAGYIQLGLIWCFVYLLVITYDHTGLNGLQFEYWSSNFAEVTYFSFVTLTTLGYGDISPNSPVMRFFVYLEAIAGVFYMAIIVAIIVSARISEHNRVH